jgi:broad specificity phosphatase PhoE
MVNITLVRHATTQWNEEGRMQGRRDIELSATGRREVLSWTLPAELRAAHWVSSPLLRAMETASLLHPAPPAIEPALIEMDWGEWEGSTLPELQARIGEDFAVNADRGLDFRPPRGESPRQVMARVVPWLQRVVMDDAPVVAVTHNGVLRALLSLATGWDMLGKPPIKLRPATMHRFVLEPGPRLTVEACNLPLARADLARGEAGARSPGYPA